jgi:hypothetical protein
MVQMKNRVSGLLMETGVEYNKQRLHKVSYFRELLSTDEEVHPSIRPLLKLSPRRKSRRGMVRRGCSPLERGRSAVQRKLLRAVWPSSR